MESTNREDYLRAIYYLMEEKQEITPASIMMGRGESVLVTGGAGEGDTLQDIERKSIIDALEKSDWVQKDAAKLLGISRRVINYKVNIFGISHPRWKKNR